MRTRPHDVLLLPRIASFALVAPLLMQLRLDRLGRLLQPARSTTDVSIERARELALLVDRVLEAGRPLLRSGCVVRGLTRYYVLRRAGFPVSLCFGIGQPGDTFAGHCWLEAHGEPFAEPRDPRPVFTEMYRFPT